MKQDFWVIHEAVILLEEYLHYVSNIITRKEAIEFASTKLRRMAKNQGKEIDITYRNMAGITFQLASMESAYLGYTKLKPATKLFTETVYMYRTHFEKYKHLLCEANVMIHTQYIEWLKTKVSDDTISSFLLAYNEINDYCLSKKFLSTSLLDTTDVNVVKGLQDVLFKHSNSTVSSTVHKLALQCYIQFLRECPHGGVDTASHETVQSSSDVDYNWDVAFCEWMRRKQISEATVRSYASAIRFMEDFSKKNNIPNICLRSNDYSQVLTSIDILLSDKGFISINVQQHNRLSAALRKVRDYITELQRKDLQKTNDVAIEMLHPGLYQKLYSISKVYDDPQGVTLARIAAIIGIEKETWMSNYIATILDGVSWATRISEGVYSFSKKPLPGAEDAKKPKNEDVKPNDFDRSAFVAVLMRRFQSGMEFDSIDLEIFRDTYSDLYDETLAFSDEELGKRVKLCGVMYKDRIFPADGIIDPFTRERLYAYIENQFGSGNQVLYYKAIFTDLSDAFAYCFSLTDETMLKAYLEFVSDEGQYFFFDSYMSKEENVEIDHSEEVVNFMLDAGKPISYEDIYAGLSHIDKDIIYREIHGSSKYVMNEREHYFHIDIFEFSQADGEIIAAILNKEIDENGYAIWSKAFESIREQLPVFLENNLYLSSLGIRNALSQFMSDRFNFEGEVISTHGVRLSMGDVFRLYAKHHTPFTDNQIYEFSKEVGSPIYFWALAEESVRVSKSLFVAKDQIRFDVDAVDKAIETYLTSGYILIKEVDSFLVFPNVGYEWNGYLLESFLLHYSKKYTLVNNGTSLNNVAGAIARKDGKFTLFVDVCAQTLADSNVELKKSAALNYLAEVNLITRRSYKEIESAMAKARQIRNRKG